MEEEGSSDEGGGGGDVLSGSWSESMAADMIRTAQIVFCTLGSAGQAIMRAELTRRDPEGRQGVDVVIVDEAAQGAEAGEQKYFVVHYGAFICFCNCIELFVTFGFGARHLLLCGDPRQLPATIISQAAVRARFNRSLMERLEECHYPSHLLDTQYR